jgi:hypothetical protein
VQLVIEVLERRELMSANPGFSFSHGTNQSRPASVNSMELEMAILSSIPVAHWNSQHKDAQIFWQTSYNQ